MLAVHEHVIGGFTNPILLSSVLLASEAGYSDCLGNRAHGSIPSLSVLELVIFCFNLLSSPCSGLHPHQTPAPLPNPGLYPTPVSMSPGQPPPQQLLAPTYFSAPGVMNFGNPSYPYAPGALPPPPPPHLYPNTQVRRLMNRFLEVTSFKSDGIVVWGECSRNGNE